MTRLEHVILRHLIYHDEYARKVLPFLKEQYFGDQTERTVFQAIAQFVTEYHANPTYEALVIAITDRTNLREDSVQEILDLLSTLHTQRQEETNLDWLIRQTESFCQDKAI